MADAGWKEDVGDVNVQIRKVLFEGVRFCSSASMVECTVRLWGAWMNGKAMELGVMSEAPGEWSFAEWIWRDERLIAKSCIW